MFCINCDAEIPEQRYALKYKTCLKCGEVEAVKERSSWCIAPMHKSNYVLVTNKEDLVGLNNKGGLVK
jgi:hypothetical protein